jgi:V/A-type H+-transporting ATPase subunit D
MAEDVKPTRKNLMAIEDRIELSERGHDTLEQKRDGLIMEFMDILDQAQDVRSDLSEDYETAQRKLNMARAMEGDVAVRGAAAALKEHPEITIQSKNIMGGRCSTDRILKGQEISRRAGLRAARLLSPDR